MRWELLAVAGVTLLVGILFTSDASPVNHVNATTQPVISVAVNGAGIAQLRRGWPVIVEGTAKNVNAGDLQLVVLDSGEIQWIGRGSISPTPKWMIRDLPVFIG